EFHQVDVTHVQGGRHQESQPFALLLVLPRQARGQVGPNRGRHRLDPAHPPPPAAPNPHLAPQLHGSASAPGNLMGGEEDELPTLAYVAWAWLMRAAACSFLFIAWPYWVDQVPPP